MTKHRKSGGATAGVYVIEGPAGVYIGQAIDCTKRGSCRLADRLGLKWGVVKKLPGATKSKRQKVETAVADWWAARGYTVVSQNTSADIQALHEKRTRHRLGRRNSPETRAKISAALKGRRFTKTTKRRMCAAQRLRFSQNTKL